MPLGLAALEQHLAVDEPDQPVATDDVLLGAGSDCFHVLLLDVGALVFAVHDLGCRKQNVKIKYCRELKSEQLKSGNIKNLDFLNFEFQMVWFSNCWALCDETICLVWSHEQDAAANTGELSFTLCVFCTIIISCSLTLKERIFATINLY